MKNVAGIVGAIGLAIIFVLFIAFALLLAWLGTKYPAQAAIVLISFIVLTIVRHIIDSDSVKEFGEIIMKKMGWKIK